MEQEEFEYKIPHNRSRETYNKLLTRIIYDEQIKTTEALLLQFILELLLDIRDKMDLNISIARGNP